MENVAVSRVDALMEAAYELCDEADTWARQNLSTWYAYNPLRYASPLYRAYVEQYAAAEPPRKAIFLGMNPGPWGMVQTGVPFGEISTVRDWLQLGHSADNLVSAPEAVHPKRPVQGLECNRSEVSGQRLWGWVAERFGTPTAFFRDYAIVNYCPLALFDEAGKNQTPDKLGKQNAAPLFEACNRFMRRHVEWLQPEWIVGIGSFAAQRALDLLDDDSDVRVMRILHPSPANPRANKGWKAEVEAQLRQKNVIPPLGSTASQPGKGA